MNVPVVSVVMPVFNAEDFVGQAVESILQQTFRDFELIAVNDGSTDRSHSILQDYASHDHRIRIVSRKHRGLVDTLNQGVEAARGYWIARMDADDIALPQRFERQLQWIEQTKADICGSWIKKFGKVDGNVIKYPWTDEANKIRMIFYPPVAHPAVMMKKSIIEALRYDKEWEKCEDYDLWDRAIRAGCKITNVPEVLLLYRYHDGQISSHSFIIQQQLAKKIRRRYLEYVCDLMKLENTRIHDLFKLREPFYCQQDMNHIDMALIDLLKNTHGEAQATVLSCAKPFYYKAAACCPDIVARWTRVNQCCGLPVDRKITFNLWLLSTFNMGHDSRFFKILKKVNFLFSRSD